MGYLTSQGSVYSFQKGVVVEEKICKANRSKFLRWPGQKGRVKFREKRGRGCHELDLSEMVSKRSWASRPSDQRVVCTKVRSRAGKRASGVKFLRGKENRVARSEGLENQTQGHELDFVSNMDIAVDRILEIQNLPEGYRLKGSKLINAIQHQIWYWGPALRPRFPCTWEYWDSLRC